MTDELKPCAHCGNDAKWIQEIQQSPDSVRLGYVRCSKCEIRTGSMLTKSEAIVAWNRRVRPDIASIDSVSLMAESVRRGLAEVEPIGIPDWLKKDDRT